MSAGRAASSLVASARSISFCLNVSMFEPAGLVVDLLAAAVQQHHARPARTVHQPAPLGQDGGVGGGIAGVVDQDAAQGAVRIAGTDIDRQLVRQRREDAVLQQEGGEAVADFPLELLEVRQRGGNRPRC